LFIVSFYLGKRNTVGIYVGKGVKGISLTNFEGTNDCSVVSTLRWLLRVDIRKLILLQGPKEIFNL